MLRNYNKHQKEKEKLVRHIRLKWQNYKIVLFSRPIVYICAGIVLLIIAIFGIRSKNKSYHNGYISNNSYDEDEVVHVIDFSKTVLNFSDTVTYQGAEWPLARTIEVYKIGGNAVGAAVFTDGLVVRLGHETFGDEGMKPSPYGKWYWEKDADDIHLQLLIEKVHRYRQSTTAATKAEKIHGGQHQHHDCSVHGLDYFSFLQIHQEFMQHVAFDTLPKVHLLCGFLTNNSSSTGSSILLVRTTLQKELMQEVCPSLTNDRFEIFESNDENDDDFGFVTACWIYVPVLKQFNWPNNNNADPLQMGMTQRGIWKPLGSTARSSRSIKQSTQNENNTDDAMAQEKMVVVYLTRHASGPRSVLNEARILDIVRNLGFEVRVPTLQDNWKIDREVIETADIIMSPHGGALANIIFARPGTKIIEFLPLSKLRKDGENSRPCYFGLALSLGLDYAAIEPKSFGFDEPMDIDEDVVKSLFVDEIIGKRNVQEEERSFISLPSH